MWPVTVLSGVLVIGAVAPPQEIEIGQVREKVLTDLAKLPNYTCTETVERSRRVSPTGGWEPVDRVRLEIALVGGHELFGWPAGARIAEADITALVGGFIGNGDFATQVRDLFTRPHTEFRLAGEEVRGDRKTRRYDYRVPIAESGWRLRGAGSEFAVGYHGSFWVDSDSLELVELEIAADDIPQTLGFSRLSKTLNYSRFRIGSTQFLLPERGRMVTAELGGDESLNETRFGECREYSVQSTVSFDPPPVDEQGDTQATDAVGTLPHDFEVAVTLDAAIDSDSAAAGDPVSARVEQPVKSKGTVVVPKGALLKGRISRMEVAEGNRYLDILFTHFDVQGRRIDIAQRRNELRLELRQSPSRQVDFTPAYYSAPWPIREHGSHLKVAKGSKLYLRSRQ